MTRSTQACFLAADRQCTELLFQFPRFRGSDPMRQTRDLARVGWRELAPVCECVCVRVCVRVRAWV